MAATAAEKNCLEELARLVREQVERRPGHELLKPSSALDAHATDPSSDGWYVEVAGIKDRDAGLYVFIDNSHPFEPRALWYGVSAGTRSDIDDIEYAGAQRWPYTQRFSGYTPPKDFRFEDPWRQRYDADEYYYGWIERDAPSVSERTPPRALIGRIGERFSELLVQLSGGDEEDFAPLGIEAMDARRLATFRREQGALRAQLLPGTSARCFICGRELPRDLMVTAHIKPRAQCNAAERRDVHNNIIPLCALGCDALFERGYLTIVQNCVVAGPREARTKALQELIAELESCPLPRWRDGRAVYFNAHRTHHTQTVKRRADGRQVRHATK